MGLLFALFLIIAIPAIAYYDVMHTPGVKPIFDLQPQPQPRVHTAAAPASPAPARTERPSPVPVADHAATSAAPTSDMASAAKDAERRDV